jgi:hypothetical protein
VATKVRQTHSPSVVDPAFEPRPPCARHADLAAAPPPLVMPAIVPGWEACLCRCHRRRRRKRALSPPSPIFLYRTVLAQPTRVAPPSSSRAPRRRPARSRSTRARTRTVHTSLALRPPRRAVHRARTRKVTPGRSRARTMRAAGPSSAAESKGRSRQLKGGKAPALGAYAPVGPVSTTS